MEDTADIIHQYASVVEDYKSRVKLVRNAKDIESLKMELQTVKMFDEHLKSLEPEIDRRILELELHIKRN